MTVLSQDAGIKKLNQLVPNDLLKSFQKKKGFIWAVNGRPDEHLSKKYFLDYLC